ncbi:MAG TPA: MFS transporter [bacterium]|nr:MFS transporter [bacterium]
MTRHRNYRLLVLIACMQGIVFYAPVATLYRRAYGLDIQGLFLIESISWVATILLEAPWGRFADKFGYRLTLILGTALFLVSKIVFAFASGFGGFLAERLLLALALAALSGCTEAMLYRSVPPEHAAKAFGRWHAASSVGLFSASIAAPLLYSASMRMAAYGTIVPYAAAFLCSLFLVDIPAALAESRPITERTPREGIRLSVLTLWRDKGLLFFLLAAAVMGEAAQSATVFLAPLQYERACIPASLYGALFALTQAAGLAAAASGRIIATYGRRCAFVSLVAIMAASLAALAVSGSAFVSITALIVLTAAAAAFRPLSTTVQNEKAHDSSRATMLSVNAIVMELMAAIMNTGVGYASALGLPIGFGALAMMVAALLLLTRSIFATHS